MIDFKLIFLLLYFNWILELNFEVVCINIVVGLVWILVLLMIIYEFCFIIIFFFCIVRIFNIIIILI